MRRTGRFRRKKQKKILIIGSLSLLLFLCVGYAAFQTNLSLTARGNIKEKTRVIQSWSDTDQTDFHSDYYKQNIMNVTFLDNNNVPSTATESWNVSEDKENGGVMAWVVPNNSDNTKHDLYIGAKGGVIANEDSSYLFYCFTELNIINFNDNFDTRNATTMRGIFCDDWNVTSINFGQKFNTSNVTNMAGMFGRCYKLNNLDLSVFDTKNVTTMESMFQDCNVLNSLDISNFNTNNVTIMRAMFARCYKLSEISFGNNFDTSNVTTMRDMFFWCSELVSIDLSKFNTENVKDMRAMFDGCENLTVINLCAFNTKDVVTMEAIFKDTPKLNKIIVGIEWNTQNAITTDMFLNSGVSKVTTGQC